MEQRDRWIIRGGMEQRDRWIIRGGMEQRDRWIIRGWMEQRDKRLLVAGYDRGMGDYSGGMREKRSTFQE